MNNARNGIVRSYIISVTHVDSNETSTVTSVDTETIVTLLPFCRYTISVAAVTVLNGPYSEYVAIEMPEDG